MESVRNNTADKELRTVLLKNSPMLNNRSTNLGETFNTASVDTYVPINNQNGYRERWKRLANIQNDVPIYGIQGSVNMRDTNKESVWIRPEKLSIQLSKEEQLENATAYFDAIKNTNGYCNFLIKRELISSAQYRILSLFLQFKRKFNNFEYDGDIHTAKDIFANGIHILLTYNDIEYNIAIDVEGYFCNGQYFEFINNLYCFITSKKMTFSKIRAKITTWINNRILFYYNCVT